MTRCAHYLGQQADINREDKDSTAWVEELEKHHGAVSGVSGATSCRQFGQGCNPGNRWSSCDDYFEQFNGDPWGWGMSSYYLFEAVKGVHRKLDKFNNRVIEGTMLSNLKVDEMINNLGGSDEGHSDVFNWITAAIGWGDFIAEQGSVSIYYLSSAEANAQPLTLRHHGRLEIPSTKLLAVTSVRYWES